MTATAGITGGLTRQTSLPNLVKAVPSKDKSTKMAFSDMVKMTFNDQSFAKTMTPILFDMISPLIQKTIATTVDAAIGQIKTSVLDEMIKSNNELKFLVTEQNETIHEQNKKR